MEKKKRTHPTQFTSDELCELEEKVRKIAWNKYVSLKVDAYDLSEEYPILCVEDDGWVPDYMELTKSKILRYGPFFITAYYEGFGEFYWEPEDVVVGEYGIRVSTELEHIEYSDDKVLKWLDEHSADVVDFKGTAIGKFSRLSDFARSVMIENFKYEIDEKYERECK